MDYIALKTDMIHSRKLVRRAEAQARFLEAAAAVNARFAPAFVARFIVTHGDEAQGLLRVEAITELYEMIEFLLDFLAPVKLRFGFGYGSLSTALQEAAIGMDGEAWQQAQSALVRAHTSRQPVCLNGFAPPWGQALEALANLLLWLKARWTREQREVVRLLREGQTQAEIAVRLGVSPPAISKRLSAAGWRHYQDGKASFRTLAGTLARSDERGL